jgi:enoyl-CoA hydratase
MARAVFAFSRPWELTAKPVIGAINGPAERGGFELALACDILIASERATFADTHASLGLVPALGLTALLPRAVGSGWARRLSLTGEPIAAERALAAGLVTEVVPHGEVSGAAREIASAIARNSADAVRAVLATYRAAEAEAVAPALRLELEAHVAHLQAASRDEVADAVLDTVLELRQDEL